MRFSIGGRGDGSKRCHLSGLKRGGAPPLPPSPWAATPESLGELCSKNCPLASSWQWHRTPTTQETDGFQVKRPGDVSVRCTLLLMLDYQVGRGLWEQESLGLGFGGAELGGNMGKGSLW